MNNYTIENFLTSDQELEILNLTTHPSFPWFFTPATVTEVDDGVECGTVIEKGINPFQFVHEINVEQCNYIGVIKPILDFIALEFNSNLTILKSKFNLLTKNNDSTYHYPHLDVYDTDNVYSAIYYVNDSDGDTYFFNSDLNVEKTVSPSKGRMVIFDSNKFHSSSSPVNKQYRIVMNVVFKLLGDKS